MAMLSVDQNIRIPDTDNPIEVELVWWEIESIDEDQTTYRAEINIPSFDAKSNDTPLLLTITYDDHARDYSYESIRRCPNIPKELLPHVFALFSDKGPLL